MHLHLELRPRLVGGLVPGFRPVLPHFLEPRISDGSITGFFAELPFPAELSVEQVSVRRLADFLLEPLCVVVVVLVVGLGRELSFEAFRKIFLLKNQPSVKGPLRERPCGTHAAIGRNRDLQKVEKCKQWRNSSRYQLFGVKRDETKRIVTEYRRF
jgi:hypothetical protein